MSGVSPLAVVLALSAGIAGSVQAAVLARFGERIGTIEAIGFSVLVSAVTGVVVMLVARHSLDGIAAGVRAPVWLWLGGALSAFIILSITIATPRIGVTAAVSLFVGAQLVGAALIDRFGWFGFERLAFTWYRVLGLVLLAAGAALVLRR